MCRIIKGTARLLMFILNTCVWLAGIAMITVGSLAVSEWPEYEYILEGESVVFTVSILVIVAGSLLFFVGLSGCLGAWKENICLLSFYFALMVLLVIVQITSGVIILVYADEVQENVNASLTIAFGNYSTDEKAKTAVDYIQSEHHCCGLDGIQYWEGRYVPPTATRPATTATAIGNNQTSNGITIPTTNNAGNPATTDVTGNVTTGSTTESVTTGNVSIIPPESCELAYYENGCIESFGNYLLTVCNVLGGLSIGLLIFDVVSMVFACCMINAIKENSNAVTSDH